MTVGSRIALDLLTLAFDEVRQSIEPAELHAGKALAGLALCGAPLPPVGNYAPP